MKGNTRYLLRAITGLLAPVIPVLIAYRMAGAADDVKPVLAGLHLATMVWAIFFYRTSFTRATLLPLSFLVSLAAAWIVEEARPSGWFPHIGTTLFSVLYALPWAVMTFAIAVVKVLRKRKIRYTQIPMNRPGDREE